MNTADLPFIWNWKLDTFKISTRMLRWM